jgi:hypothetical protein
MKAKGFLAVIAAAALWLGSAAASAQTADWRELRIDSSSPVTFERSVAALQNALPARNREQLEIALAVIWMTETVGPGGLDRDGDGFVTSVDSRLLAEGTIDLLADIQRGDLLASIEKHAGQGGRFTAADYVRELDGLGYQDVLDLAGRPEDVAAPRPLRAFHAAQHLTDYFIAPETGKVLGEAIKALNARDFGAAKKAMSRLKRDRLSYYERGKAELVDAQIAYGEGDLAAARKHLVDAIDTGGLNEEEISAVVGQIRAIDSKPTGSVPVLLQMPDFNP